MEPLLAVYIALIVISIILIVFLLAGQSRRSMGREMSDEKEKTMTNLQKIEGLIVDGQKEVLAKVSKLDEDFQGLKSDFQDLRSDFQGMKSDFHGLKSDLQKVQQSLSKQITDTYNFLSHDIAEVEKDVKEANRKLDEHIRQLQPV